MTAPSTTPFVQPGQTPPAPTLVPSEPASHIPAFEGQEVSFTKAKVSSVSGLEINDAVMKMDDMVEMRITGRILGVDHKVNAQGKLERVHLIKAIETDLIKSWDASGRETTY